LSLNSILPAVSNSLRSTSPSIPILCAVSVPLTVRSLVIIVSSCSLTLPVLCALKSKSTFEVYVSITLPAILISPITTSVFAIIFKLVTSKFNKSLLAMSSCSNVKVSAVISFLIITLSFKLTLPVPLARRSKSAFEAIVRTVLPINCISSIVTVVGAIILFVTVILSNVAVGAVDT
jgi:hypothetical protein